MEGKGGTEQGSGKGTGQKTGHRAEDRAQVTRHGTYLLQTLCLLLLLVPALGSCNLIPLPPPLFPLIFFWSYL